MNDRLNRALRDIDPHVGSGRVITDRDVLESYAKDDADVPPVMPGAVVRAHTRQDVAHTLSAAHRHGVLVTPRGAGTGRVGGAVPCPNGIVLSLENMKTIRGIEDKDLYAIVEPGVVTGTLHRAAEERGLFYPPDPNSAETCVVGGNIGTNAAGPRAYKYGVTREYVLGLEVVCADGTTLKTGRRTSKGVTGYDLTALVVGSEGTLGVVTQATLKLIACPEAVATLLAFLPDEQAIERAVTTLTARRIRPRCIELLDRTTLEVMRPQASLVIPSGAGAMLIVEVDGSAADTEAQVETVGGALVELGAIEVLVAKNATERERLWAARRDMSHSLRRLARHKISEDVVVPRTRLAELLERCRTISDEIGVHMPAYGHAGDGNLHVNFLWNDDSERPKVNKGIEALLRAVVTLGGTISGEHGIGLTKTQHLGLEQSPELIALQRQIKAVFDPRGILNPDKIFPSRSHGSC